MNKGISKILLFTAVLLFGITICSTIAKSQETEKKFRPRYGLFIDYSINMHSADFKKLPSCPNCSPGFEDGTGGGIAVGGLFELPLSSKFLLGARLMYYNYSGKLTKNETTTILVNGTPTDGRIEHRLDATLASIGLEPTLIYNAFDHLFVSAGFFLGAVTSYKMDQAEQIVSPANRGTFLDSEGHDTGKRTRNEISGDIVDASKMKFTGIFGISYELPLNRRGDFLIAPEISYALDFIKVVDNSSVTKWNVNSLRFGVAIKYSPFLSGTKPKIEKTEEFEKHQKIDTVIIASEAVKENMIVKGKENTLKEKFEESNRITYVETMKRTDTLFKPKTYTLTASLEAVGIDENKKEITSPSLIIEEFISSRLQPLLNYVFFDENSPVIPKRYIRKTKTEASEFYESKLFKKETLPSYYEILNIVGSRLVNNPKSKLRIVGCNDGFSSEKDNKGLSMQRADNVKQYLLDVWEISPSRLKVEARDLPEIPSTPISEKDKIEENRRVELYSNDKEIMQPIFSEDTLRTSNPPIIRLKPAIKSDVEIASWKIRVSQHGTTVVEFAQNNNNPTAIDWVLGENQSLMPRFDEPLEFILEVTDVKGNHSQSETKRMPLKQLTLSQKRRNLVKDKEIDKYSLILFDFDKAEINKENSSIINFIKGRIQDNSEINITGYTDRTGSDDYNTKLSQQRAAETEKAIKAKSIKSKGLGKSVLLYNNDLPEGRFYCRTVHIEVATPVK